MAYENHYPVLKDQVIKIFQENRPTTSGRGSGDGREQQYLCDCTFGGGGHSLALIEQIPQLKIIAFDQDPDAIKNGHEMAKEKGLEQRLQLINSNFSQLVEKVEKMGISGKIIGILLDLGVSSHQLMTPSRGFSLQREGPLDMRMDYGDSVRLTAQKVLAQKSEQEIMDIIAQYGEERYSRRIARKICEFRATEELHSTKQLENIVFHCYPRRERYRSIHPATRTFQALRLYVNGELEALEQVLNGGLRVLGEGGTMVAISFHSLEDRIVKHRFREFAQAGQGAVVTKRPIRPTQEELEQNKRSRSARLRIFRKESND